jgi:hypothetical protein
MPWFGVRSVYLFGRKADGTNIFEERVVCFEASNSAEALERAADESERYAGDSGFEVFPEWRSYEQDGDALIDGYEVWSALFEARMTLEEFHAARYARFDHRPDPVLRVVE